MPDMNLIVPNLWQGADPGAALPTDITSVINLRTEYPNKYHDKIESFLWVPTEDGIFKGFPWLEAIVAHLTKQLDARQKVLVHCAAGVSRSTLITAAYLIKTDHLTATQALDFIGAKRPVIGPLPRYRLALAEYYERCHGNA